VHGELLPRFIENALLVAGQTDLVEVWLASLDVFLEAEVINLPRAF
jgi:hypothetical protein